MEEARAQPQGSEQEEQRQQEEQRPADVDNGPAGTGQNGGDSSDQGEEEEAGAAGPPVAAADAPATRRQATPASHLPPAKHAAAGEEAEQPVTAEPPRKRVRFSEALEEALPAGAYGLAPGGHGVPPLPALPPQLARAAQGLALASALAAKEGEQLEEEEVEEEEEEGEGEESEEAERQQLQLLHTLMDQAKQQQQQQQAPQQQRSASPSLSPWLAALPQQARQAQHGAAAAAGVRQAASQVHSTVVRSLEDLSQLAVQAAARTAHPYALVSVDLLQALHRAAQFAVSEAQSDLEARLRQHAARADAVAAAFPPQPAAVAAAAADLRELLSQVQQVAGIARALEPGEVPLPPIQHMLEQHTARLQLLLSESLRAAGAALQADGFGPGGVGALAPLPAQHAPFAPLPAQQAPAAAAGLLAGLLGAPAVQPRQLPQSPQQRLQQVLLPVQVQQLAGPLQQQLLLPQPFQQLLGPGPASPAPRLFSDLLPMLLAGQQVEAGQQALLRLVAQRAQQAQQPQHAEPTQQQVPQPPYQQQQQQQQANGVLAIEREEL